jgi:hypothetical protein
MGSLFNTISFAQGILGPLGTLVAVLEAHFLRNSEPELRLGIMAFTAAVFAQLYSSFRKPSTDGGTIAPSVQIDPATPVGKTLVAEVPAVDKIK